MQAELEQTYPRLGTIYSLCSVYYPNIRQRSDVLNRWNFLKTGFYEGIKLDEAAGIAEAARRESDEGRSIGLWQRLFRTRFPQRAD